MAPSAAAVNVIGAIGGVVLAACLVPQVVRLYKTRSASDISYGFLALYATGLALTFVYLYFEGATVGWICMLIETSFCLLCITAKAYLDHWGPHSPRGKARAAAAAVAAGKAEGGSVGRGGSGRSELAVISVHADGSSRGGSHFFKAAGADNRLLLEVVLPAGGTGGDGAEGGVMEDPAAATAGVKQRVLSALQHAVQEAAPGGALRALPAAA